MRDGGTRGIRLGRALTSYIIRRRYMSPFEPFAGTVSVRSIKTKPNNVEVEKTIGRAVRRRVRSVGKRTAASDGLRNVRGLEKKQTRVRVDRQTVFERSGRFYRRGTIRD